MIFSFFLRNLQIKVSQIPGHTKWTAIPDCLQYHTGHSGTFRAFNHPTGTLIQAILWTLCSLLCTDHYVQKKSAYFVIKLFSFDFFCGIFGKNQSILSGPDNLYTPTIIGFIRLDSGSTLSSMYQTRRGKL